MTNMDVLAALAPPALRCIRASLPKNAAGDMEVGRRRGESRRGRERTVCSGPKGRTTGSAKQNRANEDAEQGGSHLAHFLCSGA